MMGRLDQICHSISIPMKNVKLNVNLGKVFASIDFLSTVPTKLQTYYNETRLYIICNISI